jgi:hypothetical protein
MRSLVLVAISLVLVGCGVRDLLEVMAGHKYEVVVLAKSPLVLDKTPLVLRGDRPMQVIGDDAMLCLVLQDNVSSRDSGSDELFKKSMNGTTVDIRIKLKSGTELQFHEPMPSWRQEGRILESGEFSACASACCEDKRKLSKGSEATEVRIVSSKPLKVRGIFWESTNAFDNLREKP